MNDINQYIFGSQIMVEALNHGFDQVCGDRLEAITIIPKCSNRTGKATISISGQKYHAEIEFQDLISFRIRYTDNEEQLIMITASELRIEGSIYVSMEFRFEKNRRITLASKEVWLSKFEALQFLPGNDTIGLAHLENDRNPVQEAP